MLAGGFDRAEVEKVVWDNPVAFFAQSGRLDLDAVKNSELSQGNSILRGAKLMRFRHRDDSVVHLSYCTNMHPAEDLEGIIGQLHTSPGPYAVCWLPVLGVGLWLPAPAARHLASDPAALSLLKRTLEQEQLEVVTLNGFPTSRSRPKWSKARSIDRTG